MAKVWRLGVQPEEASPVVWTMGNATPVQKGKDIIEIISYTNSKRWDN